MRTFDHFGIPVTYEFAGELYNKELHLFHSDVAQSPNKIEFLRFEPECPFHPLIKTTPHIAYSVPSIEEAIVGAKILYGPFSPIEGLTVVFIEEEGVPIELNHTK